MLTTLFYEVQWRKITSSIQLLINHRMPPIDVPQFIAGSVLSVPSPIIPYLPDHSYPPSSEAHSGKHRLKPTRQSLRGS